MPIFSCSCSCYLCHGPDTASCKPDESELVRRVELHDPDVVMPQDKEKLLNPGFHSVHQTSTDNGSCQWHA